MHLAIDVREACKAKRTGKGQWARGLLEELLKRDLTLTLLTDAPIPSEWEEGANVHVLKIKPGLMWHRKVSRFLKENTDIDNYVSTTSYIVPFLAGEKVKTAVIVHDLIAFKGEPHDKKAKVVEKITLQKAIHSASVVCTTSDSTKKDLLEQFPKVSRKKIVNIFAGPLRDNPPPNEPDGSTILCPATLCPRKNQLRLIEAYGSLSDELKNKYKLVLVGARGWHDNDIVKAAEETDGVTWRNYVPEAEYDHLLNTCTVLAYPSVYEGFGLPVLDALQRGIPILTSDRGSLAEVTGGVAQFVDPKSVPSITKGLTKILSDDELRANLSKRGPAQSRKFSWKNTANLLLQSL